MIVCCCDICRKELRGSYTDENGKLWEDISFREKRYKRKLAFMFDSWTEYLSICGKCRKAIAEYRETENGFGSSGR